MASFRPAPEVSGLYLWPEFCSEAEAAELLEFLDGCQPEWSNKQFGVPTTYRSKHFGVLATLRPRGVHLPVVDAGEADLPTEGILADMVVRLRDRRKPWGSILRNFIPNEANVNDYRLEEEPRLHMHWDDRGSYDEHILSLSVTGDATMSFARGGRSNLRSNGQSDDTDVLQEAPVRVRVPSCSLLLLSGAARYEWQHGIPDPADLESERRVSVIFRRVRIPKELRNGSAADKKAEHGKMRTSAAAQDVSAADESAILASTAGPDGLPADDREVTGSTATPNCSAADQGDEGDEATFEMPETGPSADQSATAPGDQLQHGLAADQIQEITSESCADSASRVMTSALIISTNWPDPDVSAAGRVTCSRIAMLKERGLQVCFACASRPGNAKQKLEKSYGIECERIVLNDESSMSPLISRVAPQLVLFDGFNAEERYSHYVRAAMPSALRVLDMQDFHALRLGREALVGDGASLAIVAAYRPDADSEDLQRELAAIHRCDLVFAISEDECKLLVETYSIPAEKVLAAPLGYSPPLPQASGLRGFEQRQHVMFIGNFKHKPNRDCAQWLVRHVWPHLRALLPDVELRVYGSNASHEDMALTDDRIGATVCGHCRCVASAMRSHRLLVAPIRYGAGVKGKLTDAFVHGLVTVTTPIGAEGLGGTDFPGVIVPAMDCDDAAAAQEFAQAVASTYADAELWTSLQARACSFAAEHLDAERIGNRAWSALDARWRDLLAARRRDFVGQMLWQSSLRSTEWMAKGLAAKEELRQLKAVKAAESGAAGGGEEISAPKAVPWRVVD